MPRGRRSWISRELVLAGEHLVDDNVRIGNLERRRTAAGAINTALGDFICLLATKGFIGLGTFIFEQNPGVFTDTAFAPIDVFVGNWPIMTLHDVTNHLADGQGLAVTFLADVTNTRYLTAKTTVGGYVATAQWSDIGQHDGQLFLPWADLIPAGTPPAGLPDDLDILMTIQSSGLATVQEGLIAFRWYGGAGGCSFPTAQAGGGWPGAYPIVDRDVDVNAAIQVSKLQGEGFPTHYLRGTNPPVFGFISDTDLSLTDNTTGNVNGARHGFVPKLPGDASKVFTGAGTFVAATTANDLVATWAGPLPNVTGDGLPTRVPYVGGSSVTFNLRRLFTRLESAPSSTVQFRVEKSIAGGAFTPVSIGSLSHAAGQYERENAALTGTIATGDLVRVSFANVAGGNGGAYEVQLQATIQ